VTTRPDCAELDPDSATPRIMGKTWYTPSLMETAKKLPGPNVYIEATEGVCGGKCRIAGTRIKVSLVASEYEHQRMTPDEIIEAHPHLSLAQIHGALAYYYDHQDEIRREWREAEELISFLRDRYPSRLGRAEGPA
jgi:uncharacterized protein (DUF433 family)